MSASSTSPPSTPTQPSTPPLSAPAVRVTLPTPPSFSRRRSFSVSLASPPHSQIAEEEEGDESEESASAGSDSPEKAVIKEVQWKKSHGRSVSFNIPIMLSPISPTDISRSIATSVPSPGVYRIPQRSPDYVPSSPSPLSGAPSDAVDKKRRIPPRPLSLSPASQRFVGPGTGISPTTRLGPMTAPAPGMGASSRWSSTAAARGLSIAPALAKQRHSTSSASGPSAIHSIWSANHGDLGAASGWISPALASARSIGSAARTRGLTVAVLNGNEVLLETLPTPGLGRSSPAEKSNAVKEEDNMEMLKDDVASPNPSIATGSPALGSAGDAKRPREIILCRYYHTPDLRCTSRPCRFVHDLATVGLLDASITDYNMKSPTTANLPSSRINRRDNDSPDFTSGTFAAFQAEAHKKTLSVKDVDEKGIVPGETVVVASENGTEVEGMVFLMSGGGKGPAGKGKAKYKTVLCKDFAEGSCVYGAHCSFIHDEKVPESPKSAIPNFTSTSETTKSDRRKSFDPATLLKGPPKSPWRAIPAAVRTPGVAVKLQALDRQQEGLSAFAAPFLENPVEVGKKGDLVPATPGLQSRFNNDKAPSKAKESKTDTGPWFKLDRPPSITRSRSSDSAETDRKMRTAWSKGPTVNLKTVTIDSTPIVHQSLMVPVSAVSMFGTESDPATPWDPAIRAQKIAEGKAQDEAAGIAAATDAEEDDSRNPEYPPTASYVTVVPDYEYPTYSTGMNGMPYPYSAPTYPWGMPMSPLPINAEGGFDAGGVQSDIPGGLGVMWTPTGWAVQDAAMKMALCQVENGWQAHGGKQVKGQSGYAPKTYWRTKHCKFFDEGHCPHGDTCTYIHESHPGGDTKRKSSVPKTQSKVTTNQRKNHKRHPCKFYNSAVGCTNGDSCAYLHTFVVPLSVQLVDKPRPWRTRPCRHFQVGRCQLGHACHFAHVYDGTALGMGMGIGMAEREEDEEEESSDDDLEIVTENTSIATMSPPRSIV